MINFDELIGFDKIDELVSDFCAEFDCDAEFNDEFCYWSDDETIGYTIIVGELSDEAWTEYVKDTFNYTIENIFVFSLLHELGHHFTLNNYSNRERKKEDEAVNFIEAKLKKSITKETDKQLYKEYFNLPLERVATEWAVNYARSNKEKLDSFWERLQTAFNYFYSENLDCALPL